MPSQNPEDATMRGFADYERYDALGLAELVRRRQVSPHELLEAAIERVEARNPAINAVTMPQSAITCSQARRRPPRGAVHRRPVPHE